MLIRVLYKLFIVPDEAINLNHNSNVMGQYPYSVITVHVVSGTLHTNTPTHTHMHVCVYI